MNKQNEKYFLVTFPNLYVIHKGEPFSEEERMLGGGFACGDGWFTLLDVLSKQIQNHLDNYNRNKSTDEKKLQVKVLQVKEKFGGLRFYVNYTADDYIYGLIHMTESMSFYICEKCGSSYDVQQTGSWIKSLCRICRKQED